MAWETASMWLVHQSVWAAGGEVRSKGASGIVVATKYSQLRPSKVACIRGGCTPSQQAEIDWESDPNSQHFLAAISRTKNIVSEAVGDGHGTLHDTETTAPLFANDSTGSQVVSRMLAADGGMLHAC